MCRWAGGQVCRWVGVQMGRCAGRQVCRWAGVEVGRCASKITADGDCSNEIKRCLLLERKVMTNLDSILMHWRRKWKPTPVFLPGESQGRGSLECNPEIPAFPGDAF